MTDLQKEFLANSSAPWAKFRRGNHQQVPAILLFSKNQREVDKRDEKISTKILFTCTCSCLAGWLGQGLIACFLASFSYKKRIPPKYVTRHPFLQMPYWKLWLVHISAYHSMFQRVSLHSISWNKILLMTLHCRVGHNANWKLKSYGSFIFQRSTTSWVNVLAIQIPDDIKRKYSEKI